MTKEMPFPSLELPFIWHEMCSQEARGTM